MRKAVLIFWFGILFFWSGTAGAFAQPVLQSRNGLPAFFKKIKSGKSVNIVYLGGSITQAAGYRVKSAAWFKKQFPAVLITSFNAGVGGTGSDLGLFRLPEDVLAHQPDLVFIEFAVNDYGSDSTRIARSMEGMIRQVKTADPRTDICLLYTISEAMLGDYRAGRLPAAVRMMEKLAAYYGLSSVNFAPDVLALQESGKLIFHGDKKPYGKDQLVFTADGTHPLDAGHELYTQTLERSLLKLEKLNTLPGKIPEAKYITGSITTGRYDPAHFKSSRGWKKVSETDSMRNFLKAFPRLCWSSDSVDSLVVEFEGTQFGLEDVIGPASNGFLIRIDGQKPYKVIRFDKYCSRYRRHYFLLDPLPVGKHKVVIRPDFTPIDKKGLLKPEDRALYNNAVYGAQRMYIGNMLIAGKLLRE